jgi:galactofuranose transport system substrate-binding protein
MAKVMNEKGNIVLVHGTEGHPAAEGRKIGFLEAISAYPDLKIIDFANSDFTNDGGYAVMAKFLKAKGSQINGAYFANDEMAFGGIRAIKAAGKKPGVDIKIISTDGSRAGFTAMIAGEINAEVECNPLFGPLFFETALKAANGEMLPREVFVKDSVYFQDVAETELPNRTW